MITLAGSVEILDLLPANKLAHFIETRDSFGVPPSPHTVQWGKKAMVEALLNKGADPHVIMAAASNTASTAKSYGLLEIIAHNGHNSILRLLLARGIKFDFTSPLI